MLRWRLAIGNLSNPQKLRHRCLSGQRLPFGRVSPRAVLKLETRDDVSILSGIHIRALSDAGYSKTQAGIACVTSGQPHIVDQTGLAEENGQ